MILLIFLLVLFFIITGLLVLFVFSVFIPSISQSGKNEEINSYIFASDELKSTEENQSNLKDTGLRAVVKCNSSKDFSEKRFDYTNSIHIINEYLLLVGRGGYRALIATPSMSGPQAGSSSSPGL